MRKPLIGVMGLTAELYKKKFPDFVERLDKHLLDFLQHLSQFFEVVPSPVLYNRNLVKNAYDRMIESDVDGIIIIFLSYSPSMIIEPVIKNSKVPILIWNTQQIFEITENFSTFDTMDNHGMHGVQDLASVLLRENVKFSIVTGHKTQKDTMSNIESWGKCAAINHDLKKLRVGRIGGIFKDMGDFSIPDEKIKKILGPSIIDIDMKTMCAENRAISDREIESVMKDEENRFILSEDLDDDTRKKTIRFELGLRNLIKKFSLEAIAINFITFKGQKFCEAIPFSAISKFISEGMGYAGEGDCLCAISVWMFQKLAGIATFTEMFTTDYKNNRIFMSHMGESNILMVKHSEKIKLVKKDMSISAKNTATCMFLFQMKPGQVTLLNLAPCNGNIRLITTVATIEDQQIFSSINAPHFLLKIDGDVRDFLTCYSMLGGTHHLAMAYGDITEQLRLFASIAGIEFAKI